LELFKEGKERHEVAGEIFYQFGKQFEVPEHKLNTAMIDLSITCAESDFKDGLCENETAKEVEDKWIRRLIG
jgi:hypothetical protein